MNTAIKPYPLIMAAAILAGITVTPAAVAQLKTIPVEPPGGGTLLPVVSLETQTECEIFAVQRSVIEICPSQTGSSTANQFFDFVSNLGTRISQQRHVVRDTNEESEEEEEKQSYTTAFGPALGGAAGADSGDGGITEYGRLSAFGIVDYSESDRGITSSGQSYDQETEAGILGFDYRVSNTLFAGATLNYLSGDTVFGGNTGAVDVDSYVLGLHGSKYLGDGYLEVLVTYGRFDLDIERIEALGLLESRYDASPDGELASFDVALGSVQSFGRWRIGPLVKLLYLDGSIDGYTENLRSDSGSPRTFEKQDFSAFNMEWSWQVDYVVLTGWGVLIPSLKVSYHREMDDRHTVRGVHFGSLPFAEKTDEPDRNTVVARVGASAQFKRGWSGFVSYEKLFEHSYLDRENIVVGVRYEFF